MPSCRTPTAMFRCSCSLNTQAANTRNDEKRALGDLCSRTPAPATLTSYPSHDMSRDLLSRHITLDINLGSGASVVSAEMDMERNPELPGEPLFLDGEDLKLFNLYIRLPDDRVRVLKVTGSIRWWHRWHAVPVE